MDNYWDGRFQNEKLIWGIEPSKIAIECAKIFKENKIKNVLIMGIGYGRNGKVFVENGFIVEGVEISIEAILLGKQFCPQIKFTNGSVLDIKLDKKYDAIFCYSILHLFREDDRKKLLDNCIHHCVDNGLIAVSCCSTEDKTYGTGNIIEENTFEIKKGKIMHFYKEEEMSNLNKKLKCIKLGFSLEKIETEGRKEEYNMVYGIYQLNNCCPNY